MPRYPVYRTTQNGNKNRENPVMWEVRKCNNALDTLYTEQHKIVIQTGKTLSI